MVFSSLEFLACFLPFCLASYALIPRKYKNAVLLFYSLAFYFYGVAATPLYFALIVISVLINWMLGNAMAAWSHQKKTFLAIGLLWDFGCLFVFKYADFFIGNINRFAGTSVPFTNLVLPLGISFFTFQIASYLIDVYRGTVQPEQNPIDLATYILCFPQLIAGPIVRFSDVQKEIHERTTTSNDIVNGACIFIIGLGKKVLLANQLGGLWSELGGIGYESVSTSAAWLGILAYSLQLYFDFSGYSQMAIGLGKILGFHFPENFNFPYISRSMTEFWRRWHITLGAWFREYVYIPLGGNRKGTLRTFFNLFVVWTLTGFWHGADWNFLLWGFLLFVLIMIEKAGFGAFLDKHRIFSHVYMTLLIPLSWLVFAVSDLQQLGIYFAKLFGGGGETLFHEDYLRYLHSYGRSLLLGILFATPLPKYLLLKLQKSAFAILQYLLLLAVLGLSCYCIYRGMNDPFLYFRF